MFAALLYTDNEFPSPPYDLTSEDIQAMPFEKFFRCCLVTMGFYIKEAFAAYMMIMPYVQ